jgi:hypothetical protein
MKKYFSNSYASLSGYFSGSFDAFQPLRRVTETTFGISIADFIETSHCDILAYLLFTLTGKFSKFIAFNKMQKKIRML